MAGGGSAPAMKMSDVFILIGVTFLIGGLFIHGFVSPVNVDAEAETYTNGASLLQGDTIEMTIEVENQSTFEVEISDEDGNVEFFEQYSSVSGESVSIVFEADEKSFYSYSVNFTEGSGDVFVDVDRKLLFDFIIYPLGIFCVIFGLAKRKDEKMNESIDAVLEPSD